MKTLIYIILLSVCCIKYKYLGPLHNHIRKNIIMSRIYYIH